MDTSYGRLTFELSSDQSQLNIFGDRAGLGELLRAIAFALRDDDHQHLQTREWGGDSLSSDPFMADSNLINMVTIYPMFEDDPDTQPN